MEFHQHIKTRIGSIWILDASKNGFHKPSSEARQSYEARVLSSMIQEVITDSEIDHEANGAPIIKNHPKLHVSISHSLNWFAIYISELRTVGIDIEIDSNQIEKTRKYFLTKSEMEDLQPSIQELQVCWGIKESVFKMLRGNVKSMINGIEIVSIDKGEAKANYQNQEIKLRYQRSEFFTLVYTS